MKRIIVSDIFGKTPALIALAELLNADMIIEPYHNNNKVFDDESQAYQYFSENIGLDSYAAQLANKIANVKEDVVLIGFSVGAAAIWQLSDIIANNIASNVKAAFCFYGGQIRHSTEISLQFDVTLIFPESEPHFNVSALIQLVSNKKHVNIKQVDYLHGFMNALSNNFNQRGYEQHIALMQRQLKTWDKN